MSKDSKRFPERRKTTNYRRIIADVSQILRRDSPMHLRLKKYRRMFGDCSANIPRLVADHRRIFAEHFSRQNIANGSWKISKQALKILGIGEMLPHEYHEFRLFAEGSFIPPEHRLMLVNFHRECIGDAKKAQWDRGIIVQCVLLFKSSIVQYKMYTLGTFYEICTLGTFYEILMKPKHFQAFSTCKPRVTSE